MCPDLQIPVDDPIDMAVMNALQNLLNAVTKGEREAIKGKTDGKCDDGRKRTGTSSTLIFNKMLDVVGVCTYCRITPHITCMHAVTYHL